MLSQPVYALYVTHVNGEWRRLEPAECPLMVQLDWVKESGDKRFFSILKKRNDLGESFYKNYLEFAVMFATHFKANTYLDLVSVLTLLIKRKVFVILTIFVSKFFLISAQIVLDKSTDSITTEVLIPDINFCRFY